MFKRTVKCGFVSEKFLGQNVTLCGWVESTRDHGGVIFLDIVDITGEVQTVFNPRISEEAYEKAKGVNEWYVVRVEGKVIRRPEGTENPNISTGLYEVQAHCIEVLNESRISPFTLRDEPDEWIRLKYRYIDLRRPKMRRNILFRNEVTKAIREFMWSEGFIEVETPFLTKSTPEGARDYLVPSRLYPGKFYALPQSPQLFKQILQVAGFERYFQIVRCFRDEDLRADRQPEFTQIDIEMSFVDENNIMDVIERLLKYVFEKTLGVKIEVPFKRLPYDVVMREYGTDKPDLRIPFKLVDMTSAFQDSTLNFIKDSIKKGGKVKGFSVPLEISRQKLLGFEHEAKSQGAGGILWFSIKGKEIRASNILKHLTEGQKSMLLKYADGDPSTIMCIAADEEMCNKVMSKIIRYVARIFGLLKESFEFLWVVDFPLLAWDEDEERYVSMHHPFTSPKPEDERFLDLKPEAVRARAYDIVINGEEIGGGSIRIHRKELQKKIFSILKISEKEAEERFGFLLEALSYGAPPHGGIALGLDRLVALMLGEESIRDVIPFPKTQSAICPLTDAPSEVAEKQLKELGLKLRE